MSIFHVAYLMLPIVSLIGLGFVFLRLKILTTETTHGLLKFLIYIAFPGVIISHLSKEKLIDLLNPGFMMANILAVLIMYIVTFILFKGIFKKDLGVSSLAALTTSFVSAGIVGLPIMDNIIGIKMTLMPVILNTVISLVFAVPLTIFFVRESAGERSGSYLKILTKALIDSLKNPLIISSIVGIIILIFNIPLPSFLTETLDKMGDATFAVALVAVGAGIDFKTFKKTLHQILFLSFLRMVVFSLLGFVLALEFNLSPSLAMAFVMIMSLPSAKAVPAIAQEYKTFADESFQVVTLTTLLTIIVMPIVVYVGSQLWPGIVR